jgi:hypothetical protein
MSGLTVSVISRRGGDGGGLDTSVPSLLTHPSITSHHTHHTNAYLFDLDHPHTRSGYRTTSPPHRLTASPHHRTKVNEWSRHVLSGRADKQSRAESYKIKPTYYHDYSSDPLSTITHRTTLSCLAYNEHKRNNNQRKAEWKAERSLERSNRKWQR